MIWEAMWRVPDLVCRISEWRCSRIARVGWICDINQATIARWLRMVQILAFVTSQHKTAVNLPRELASLPAKMCECRLFADCRHRFEYVSNYGGSIRNLQFARLDQTPVEVPESWGIAKDAVVTRGVDKESKKCQTTMNQPRNRKFA